MWYDFAVDVPANTLYSAPITQEMKLSVGVIHHVEVGFRYGPNHEVGVRIVQGGHQLWPTNPDSDFRGDGYALILNESYKLEVGNNIIKAICYSPGTSYDHRVFIRIGVLSQEEVAPLTGLGGALKRFLNLVGVGP